MLASQQLSWFSLPVIADQSLSTSSWITAPRRSLGANHQASLSDLARSFCQDTSSEFDPESSGLPATSEIVSPSPASVHDQYQSCFNHVNRSLQILYHEQERDQAFLASWKWKWEPLVHNDTDRPRPQSSTTVPIPIHHIWIGHALPNGWKELQRQWAKHHHPTEFSFHLHHDPALDSLTHAKDPRMLSDIKRLEVLYTFGGIYSDLDVWPVQSFLPLVQQARQCGCVLFGLEDPSVVSNSVIISPYPRHPYLHWLLKHLDHWMLIHNGRRAFSMTGPKFVTHGYNAAFQSGLVGLLDVVAFNPIHFSAIAGQGGTSRDLFIRWQEQEQEQLEKSSMVFAVQTWNSHLSILATKFEFINVFIDEAEQHVVVVVDVFPWIGERTPSLRLWNICAQLLAMAERKMCQPLPLSSEIKTFLLPVRVVVDDREKEQQENIVRVWVENEHSLPLSRSSKTTVVKKVIAKKAGGSGKEL